MARKSGATLPRVLLAIRALLGIAYAYGAAVHVANMASATGFDWGSAPLKWQLLDVVYLVIDVCAVGALIRRERLGFLIVLGAGLSQIVLYTALRGWVTDVPAPFALDAEELATSTVW